MINSTANSLFFEIPFIPPSNNKTYIIVSDGRRHYHKLSQDAEKFIVRCKDYISLNYFEQLNFFKPPENSIFSMVITTYFIDVKTKGKEAKYPYKRKDVLWGAKLLQDTLCNILNLDDLFHFEMILRKRQSKKGIDYTTISLQPLELSFIELADIV